MAYDISEIKKLSTEEKLQVIDEIWETMEGEANSGEDTFEESPEVEALLIERLKRFERGEMKSYSWEEAKEMLQPKLQKANNG